MPDKNFQTAPCGSGWTKRTKRDLNATPVNAALGVDLMLPLTLGTILSPLSPFLSAGYGQKIILGSGSALAGVQDQRQKGESLGAASKALSSSSTRSGVGMAL